MKTRTLLLWRRFVAALSLSLVAIANSAIAGESYLVHDASVIAHCVMTVGGGFEAKTSALTGQIEHDPARAADIGGALVLELSSIETGIGLRDRHLRENYLEVARGAGFATATMTNITLDEATTSGLDGDITFTADLALHGETRRVNGTARAEKQADGLTVSASFTVVLPDHGIAKPRHLGVGVKDSIKIDIRFKLRSVTTRSEGNPS